MNLLKGVVVPMVSPCTPAGEIDVEGVRSVVRWMLDSGANAIFAAGSTGRGPWFPLEKKVQLCRCVAREIGPEVPLLAGCMAPGIEGMLEHARALADAGAQAAVATAPFYFSYSQEELTSIFLRFADQCPIPVLIYDIPAFTGTQLDAQLILKLAGHQNVIGFKDSSGDGQRFAQLVESLKSQRGFVILQGKEKLLSAAARVGASGFVVSFVHFGPTLFVELWKAATTGDIARADRLQERVDRIYDVFNATLASFNRISTLFHVLNRILVRRGICRNILIDHESEMPPALRRLADEIMSIADTPLDD
jgi:4-hydroxy-tetrahydrodipicolinate synthase